MNQVKSVKLTTHNKPRIISSGIKKPISKTTTNEIKPQQRVTKSTKELPKVPSVIKKPTHKRTQSHIPKVTNLQSKLFDQPSAADGTKVLQSIKDSMKIFEKIQLTFEQSTVAHNIFEIKTILKDIKVNEYPYISDFEKKMISEQIAESSTQRIKTYQNLLNIINISIKDLKGYFIDYYNKGKIIIY
jgi:hypothetical protein